ncbi:ATP-binding protein [Thermovibrio sp.]
MEFRQKRLYFLTFLVFLLFGVLIVNTLYLKGELESFYLTVIREETSRVESLLSGTVAGGGDPVEALHSYMESSKLLKGATFSLEGREVIVPGSKISANYYKVEISVPPFKFTLYFDFSPVKELEKHVWIITLSSFLIVVLGGITVYLLLRELFKERIEVEREKAYSLAVSSILHEVKNSINTLNLLAYKVGRVEPKLGELFFKQLNRLSRLVEESKGLKGPLSLNLSECRPGEVLKELLFELLPSIEENGIELKTELEEISFSCDREKLKEALFNVIKNAVEALEEFKGKREIVVEGFKEGDFYTLRVKDSAGSLPLSGLFEPYRTTKKKGFGLGLYYFKRVVEAHGGKVRGYREKGWSVVELKLPIRKNFR